MDLLSTYQGRDFRFFLPNYPCTVLLVYDILPLFILLAQPARMQRYQFYHLFLSFCVRVRK